MRSILIVAAILSVTLPTQVRADRALLVLGGRGANSLPWGEEGNKITAFDVTPSKALQLREYPPYRNLLRTLDAVRDPANASYYAGWYSKTSASDYAANMKYVEGEDPVDFGARMPDLVDSNLATMEGWTIPTWSHLWDHFTFGVGLPMRVNRFVFYPAREGMAADVQAPYPETYMKSYDVSGDMFGPQRIEPYPPPPLKTLLRREPNNFESIVVIAFPLQTFRFFRLMNTTSMGFSVAELELYGEGFAPRARFTSRVISIPGDQPVNFGGIFFDFKKFRWQKEWTWTGDIKTEDLDQKRRVIPALWKMTGGDPEPVLLGSDAPLSISVEMRTGSDDTPLVYHKVNATGDGEEVVTMDDYFQKMTKGPRATDVNPATNPLLPNMQGSVTDDADNWSQWSSPETVSGRNPTVRDFRRYVQVRINVESKDVWNFGRLDSLWIEYSPPLAQDVVGEVAVLGDPRPAGGIAEMEGGEEVALTYDLKARFNSPKQGGFNVVRIHTPSRAKLEALYQAGIRAAPEPRWQWNETDRTLEVYLPKKVEAKAPGAVRVVLRTVVLTYGTEFDGEVADTGSRDLPQAVEPGNASEDVSTNRLQVSVSERSLKKVLIGVSVTPNPMTPDGDGLNDVATISYTLLRVSGQVSVDVGIYNLSGSRIGTVIKRREGSGAGSSGTWNGRDDRNLMVRPGVYLCRIRVETDGEVVEEVRPIAVVY